MPELSLLIDKLEREHSLSETEYRALIEGRNETLAGDLRERAVQVRKAVYGNTVFVRGLIEISSWCKNNCYYCGIRAGNPKAERYRLTPEEILLCCREGWALGFRTFVLQGGEDPWFTDGVLEPLLRQIKAEFPGCAITLSLGERSRESYQRLYDAGADRYLLRHETADKSHYESLHPAAMSWDRRMECLRELKQIGYQVGCGFMVGSPGQTARELAKDLKFIEEFHPAMCGIGPFIPHKDTPFGDRPGGSVELSCYLLSILRLIQPNLLLPATTALGTLDPLGREKGIQSGANVVMPNLSPVSVRKKYMLYDNKICTGEESAQCRGCLSARMASIGYEIVTDRGDPKTI
ncbi:MAG: [Oscillospiraceae bacterium]|nr:[FeFe] hydrogenase H-cluster radical SAM maturase HydE [Oscillospiraceae bacterium]